MPIPLDVDALYLNPASITLDAGELRRADAALLAGADGVPFGGIARHSDTSLAVTVNGSDQVTVQPGSIIVPGNAVSQSGAYRASVPAAQTQALTARNSTNPRITRVVFRILDTDVVPAHGAYKGRLEFIDYTPAATPTSTMTALPSMAVELARITVPNTGGGAATVDSTWRTYACTAGGELVVPTATRLPGTNVPNLQRAVALDTRLQWVWTGSAWTPLTQRGSTVVTTNAGGFADITFPAAFASAPVVTMSLGDTNANLILMQSTVVPTLFTVKAVTLAGAAHAGSIRVNWIATL